MASCPRTAAGPRKEATRARDALAAERRRLPMVAVTRQYLFDGPDGSMTLRELFGPHPQLIIYHFMFHPDWDTGCALCSYFADNFTGDIGHLAARDTAFAAVSRAPLAKLQAFAQRMDWQFPWVSAGDGDFTYDFGVTLDEAGGHNPNYNYTPLATLRATGAIRVADGSDLPGLSVFYRDGARIFHTYSTYGRGLDELIGT
jgi:predicted dithiol-disulfide oxidoreductase (DUF899 family)